MKIRLADWPIVPARRARSGEEPGKAGVRSATWRCPACGAERHFPGPVEMYAAVPCSVCGANTAAAPADVSAERP